MNKDFFSNQTLLELTDCLFWFIQRYYLPKRIFKSYNVIINIENSYDLRYEEIRKLIIGKGEDCTTGLFLDYEHTKNQHKLIAVDLSGQNEIRYRSKSNSAIRIFCPIKKLKTVQLLLINP